MQLYVGMGQRYVISVTKKEEKKKLDAITTAFPRILTARQGVAGGKKLQIIHHTTKCTKRMYDNQRWFQDLS